MKRSIKKPEKKGIHLQFAEWADKHPRNTLFEITHSRTAIVLRVSGVCSHDYKVHKDSRIKVCKKCGRKEKEI